MSNLKPLTANARQFVAELLATEDLNATEAYLRVRPDVTRESAATLAHNLLADPRVRELVADGIRARQERLKMTQDDVVHHLVELVEADPRDLTEWIVGACRHCHGDNHRYQRTPAEFEADLHAHIDRRATSRNPDPMGLEFDLKGGVGYNPYKSPHTACPECYGRGVGFEVVKDTRTLPKAAARLFAGIKRTKNGIEVLTRSQDKALELLGRHNGIFKDSLGLVGPNGGPVQHEVTHSLGTDPTQAAALYQQLVGGGS